MSAAPTLILLAEDEPTIRMVLTEALSLEGHTVVAVEDGLKALSELERSEFDAVVCDVRMPGRDGVEVLRAVKEASPDTEVVMTTAHANLQVAIECLRAGAFDFVPKPINIIALSSTVARAVERRNLRAASALLKASHAVFSTKVEHLPEVVVEVAGKVMSADHVSLMLPGVDGKLYIAHSSGLPPEVEEKVTLALGERVAGRIAVDRAPVLLNHGLGEDPRFAGLENFGRVESSIVFPLTSGDRLVGVLNLGRRLGVRPFRKADLERAAILASQVLLALENARMLRQMVASERLASIGQLAAGVAHEINNPVSYVLANLQLIRTCLDRLAAISARDRDSLWEQWQASSPEGGMADLARAAADAEEGALRIREIVRDMGGLARGQEESAELFDLGDAIRSALRVAAAEMRTRAKLTIELQGGLEVRASAGPMSQVLVNLLVNAAHAVREVEGRPREIRVKAFREEGRVLAEVSDTGIGIAPQNLGRIFQPFFTTKDPSTGTGLGLYISREIVRRYGGEIQVRSELGKGTTFTVSLPAAAMDPPAAEVTPAPAGQLVRRPQVLFVDDEATILRTYERFFGREFDISLAQGGAQALEAIAKHQSYDLVVCDLLMGSIDGMDVYRKACGRFPRLCDAFVFVTGSREHAQVREFLKTVKNRVLEKPFELDLLRGLVRKKVGAA